MAESDRNLWSACPFDIHAKPPTLVAVFPMSPLFLLPPQPRPLFSHLLAVFGRGKHGRFEIAFLFPGLLCESL